MAETSFFDSDPAVFVLSPHLLVCTWVNCPFHVFSLNICIGNISIVRRISSIDRDIFSGQTFRPVLSKTVAISLVWLFKFINII